MLDYLLREGRSIETQKSRESLLLSLFNAFKECVDLIIAIQ